MASLLIGTPSMTRGNRRSSRLPITSTISYCFELDVDNASNIGVENDENADDEEGLNSEGRRGEYASADDKNNMRDVKKRKSGEEVVYVKQKLCRTQKDDD